MDSLISKVSCLRALNKHPRRPGVNGCVRPSVDFIYIAASARDARYTRICAASVRYFYPEVPIRLLAGGRLEYGLTKELKNYWDVGLADLPAGDYGWGFVKLEPLFGSPGERFLILDSDTVFTGPVLDLWNDRSTAFLVDDESQSEENTNRLYYNWQLIRDIDPTARPPEFVFNTGQWFGSAGILTRDDFAPWLEWSLPRRLRHPAMFMPGDQGILNYVLNQKRALGDLAVARRKLMYWPGYGMPGVSMTALVSRTASPAVIHWAGIKAPRLSSMPGAEILRFFEAAYYAKIWFGNLRRILNIGRHLATQRTGNMQVRATLTLSKIYRYFETRSST